MKKSRSRSCGLDALLKRRKRRRLHDVDRGANNEEIKGLTYLPVEWLFERKISASSRHEPCAIRKDLHSSIRNQVLCKPIVVRPQCHKPYEICGEARWRCCQKLG